MAKGKIYFPAHAQLTNIILRLLDGAWLIILVCTLPLPWWLTSPTTTTTTPKQKSP